MCRGVASPRVQFIHGLEGSPQGAKAVLFDAHFTALTPAMDTSDFEASVGVQTEALARFRPDVLVGSSFGGGVAVALLERGTWRGPTLLLAQAAVYMNPEARLPADVDVWLVHGLRDDLVAPQHSRQLAATGDPARVRLIELDDDHSLHGATTSGELVQIVEDLFHATRGE